MLPLRGPLEALRHRMCAWHYVHVWQKGKKEPGAFRRTAKNTEWLVQGARSGVRGVRPAGSGKTGGRASVCRLRSGHQDLMVE